MADRVGIITRGEIHVVEEKIELMRKLGRKELHLQLERPLDELPRRLDGERLALVNGGTELVYTYDAKEEHGGIARLLRALDEAGIAFKDLHTVQSSLEDVFVSLVEGGR